MKHKMTVGGVFRPATLAEIAAQSDSLEAFGRHTRDWLHEVAKWSSRRQAATAVSEEPPLLAGHFAQGDVADALLGAYAEMVSARIGLPAPTWVFDSRRFLQNEPWFSVPDESTRTRLFTLRDTPNAFKRRNLFTAAVELPLRLRAGRPRKTAEEKRSANALRQRVFRERRKEELNRLRGLAAGTLKQVKTCGTGDGFPEVLLETDGGGTLLSGSEHSAEPRPVPQVLTCWGAL